MHFDEQYPELTEEGRQESKPSFITGRQWHPQECGIDKLDWCKEPARASTATWDDRINPTFLTALISIYMNQDSTHVQAVQYFLEQEMIVSGMNGQGYVLTKKGAKYLDMVTAAPFPVQVWVDPRSSDRKQ